MSIYSLLSTLPSNIRLAGLSDEKIINLQDDFQKKLPENIISLLKYSSGFYSEQLDLIDFTGSIFPFEFKEIFPHGIPLAQSDGNFWVQDINDSGEWGNVFFFCHDPPIICTQFSSLDSFIQSVFEDKDIIEKSNDCAGLVWENINAGVCAAEVMKSNLYDEKLINFAHSLDPHWRIYDCRLPSQAGCGFPWGLSKYNTQCKRLNFDLIFALEVAEKKNYFSFF